MTVRTERLITFMTPTRAKTTKLYTMPVEASYKALGRANMVSSRDINECYKSNRSPHRRIRLLDVRDDLP